MKAGDVISISEKHMIDVMNGGGWVDQYKKLMTDIYHGKIPNKFVLSDYDGDRFAIYGWTWKNMPVGNGRILPYKNKGIFDDEKIFMM